MIELRIPNELFDAMTVDVERAHEFAFERVGYAYGMTGTSASGALVLLSAYYAVQDQHYIDDPSVGARIDSLAIVESLDRARNLAAGGFHVHKHTHKGRPWFSRTDLRELPGLVRPFRVLVPNQCHGAILLSEDNVVALVWTPNADKPTAAQRVTIVGHPLRVFGVDYV